MQETIKKVCEELTEFLLAKNKAYGDSASNPVRIFSKTDPLEQINIRIDDKLSRIARGNEFDGDDTELDLIGYLVLKRAIKRKNTEDWQQDADIYAGRKEETLRREAPGRSGYQMVEPVELKGDLEIKSGSPPVLPLRKPCTCDRCRGIPPIEQYCDEEEATQTVGPILVCGHLNKKVVSESGTTYQCTDCGALLAPTAVRCLHRRNFQNR